MDYKALQKSIVEHLAETDTMSWTDVGQALAYKAAMHRVLDMIDAQMILEQKAGTDGNA
jgi:hypothetical protein